MTAVTTRSISFENFKIMAVDEADHVFEAMKGRNFFKTWVTKIHKTPFRLLMTSATMTDDFENVVEIIKRKMNVVSFVLPKEELTLKNVLQFMIYYEGDM